MKAQLAALLSILLATSILSGFGGGGRSHGGSEDELPKLKEELSGLRKAFEKFKCANTHNEGLISNLSRTSPPVGTVVAFAGSWPPKDSKGKQWTEDELGWMLVDDRPLDATKHAELIAVLGSNQLPNYCGLFLRGRDFKFDGSRQGRDPEVNRSVNSTQDWATGMPRNAFSTGGAGKFNFDDYVMTGPPVDDGKLPRWPAHWVNSAGTPALIDFRRKFQDKSVSQPDHTHSIGGGDPESRPINAAVHWIIKFK